MYGKKEFGDYQTPVYFADQVCSYLKNQRGIKPNIVIEPTCGIGNFLHSSLIFHSNAYYGIEMNPDYCARCRERFPNEKVSILQSDIFQLSFDTICPDKTNHILIIGNPPWATNGMLSFLGSDNIPVKSNFKGLKGIDAVTGTSNFDICEYIILKLIREFSNTDTTLAMLCKTHIARNIFAELVRTETNYTSCDILEFNAKKIFHISASACLLVIQLSSKDHRQNSCSVFSFDAPDKILGRLQYIHGQVQDQQLNEYPDYGGVSCFNWRQGVKHDCSSVMELTIKDGIYVNGLNEPVEIENEAIYPLVKSSMFKSPIINVFSKYVIVTQKKARDNTAFLAESSPALWSYLTNHKKLFDSRKSSIYLNAPAFSMFGIGDYSFSKYKVGLSGFYKKPLFCVLYSENGKPVMADDTSYFIGFDDYDSAYTAMLLLNSEPVQRFIIGSAFLDSKRPYTKKLLNQISFNKIINDLSIEHIKKTESALGLVPYVSEAMYQKLILNIDDGQQYLPLEYLIS